MNLNNIDSLKKIYVWIFDDNNEKYFKTQVKSTAHCLTEYWSIYYNKNNAIGANELGHLMSEHYWGYIKSKKFKFLINEGFAFLVDENGYFDFDYYPKAKEVLNDKKYAIKNLIQPNSEDNYKSKAFVFASFLKYLISQYGLDKFVQLW